MLILYSWHFALRKYCTLHNLSLLELFRQCTSIFHHLLSRISHIEHICPSSQNSLVDTWPVSRSCSNIVEYNQYKIVGKTSPLSVIFFIINSTNTKLYIKITFISCSFFVRKNIMLARVMSISAKRYSIWKNNVRKYQRCFFCETFGLIVLVFFLLFCT